MWRTFCGMFISRDAAASPTMISDIPRLLTRREAAISARLSYGGFCSLMRKGEGPAVTTLGKKHLIREDALTAWIDSRTGTSSGDEA
jgi:hypothetical protein